MKPQAREKLTRRERADRRFAWLLNLPAILIILALIGYPVLYSFRISLYRHNLRQPQGMRFIGFGNYAALLADDRFWHTLNRTVAIVSAAVGLEFCLGLLVAYGLYRLTFAVRDLCRDCVDRIGEARRNPTGAVQTEMF